MILKICGLARPQDLAYSAKCGADILGMIVGVPESPRHVLRENIGELLCKAGDTPVAFLFRNTPEEMVMSLIEEFSPTYAHFCGDEGREELKVLNSKFPKLRLMKAVGVPLDNPSDNTWLEQIKEFLEFEGAEYVVLDSKKKGKTGGTGISFPFKHVAEKLGNLQKKVIIAGGLDLQNIPELLQVMSPAGIDLSSGLESSAGVKDHDLISKVCRLCGKTNEPG